MDSIMFEQCLFLDIFEQCHKLSWIDDINIFYTHDQRIDDVDKSVTNID